MFNKIVSADLHICALNLYKIYVAWLKLATPKTWIKTPRLIGCDDFLRRYKGKSRDYSGQS